MLSLDHVILRTARIETTLATLRERVGAPVLAEPAEVGGLRSGIVRAGPIDIELLEIGAERPVSTLGYGLGFVADRPLEDAIDVLRAAGIATSAPVRASLGRGGQRRSWRAVQVHGLLPEPFPIATTTRPFGALDRFSERVGSALARLPGVAAAATRDPGGSMVVVTEYEFDVTAYRSRHDTGPRTSEVVVRTDGHLHRWSDLPLAEPSLLTLHDDGPPGISQLTFADGWDGEAVQLGHVRLGRSGRSSRSLR